MNEYPTSQEVDILFLMEGSYPFIKGGVSNWVHHIISSMPQYRFGVIFLGASAENYAGLCYELPSNLIHLEAHYLFAQTKTDELKETCPHAEKFQSMCLLHKRFSTVTPAEQGDLLAELHAILSNEPQILHEHFLHSMAAWNFLQEQYLEKCPDIVFLEYFWSVRNMHSALWRVIELTSKMPKAKVLHSASTGYAGFLAALLHYQRQTTFILTEHGIYTKERKFDLQAAEWDANQHPMQFMLQKKTQEYLRDLWIRFFITLARFCYSAANPVISLFKLYSLHQIEEGTPEENAHIIPNGVVIDTTYRIKKTPSTTHPVVAFIGRIVSIKDLKTFIRVVVLLHEKNPDLKAWIVGPAEEDPMYAQECRDLVSVLGLDTTIQFLGVQPVSKIFPNIDLLFLTSMSEGMPLCVLEAFSYGIPVIATDVGSCSELIYGHTDEDRLLGAAGSVVNIGDVQALSNEADKLLKDQAAWAQASLAAYQRVEKFYQQKDVLQKYADLYGEVMTKWQG